MDQENYDACQVGEPATIKISRLNSSSLLLRNLSTALKTFWAVLTVAMRMDVDILALLLTVGLENCRKCIHGGSDFK
jgi:hypothetical protein